MGYKVGVDKQQLSLLPVCLEDYVPENHVCRIIDAFTGQIDIAALGYKYAELKNNGCPPYDPRMMLNLYIYGYLHRVRSSRRLRDEAVRNVEVMWLLDGLRPDDKTICNFRKDNAKALKETFREFVLMCREAGLYGGELIATDSTKFLANNSLKNTHNEIVVTTELSRIEKRIVRYIEELEEADKEEAGEKETNSEEIKAVLEKLKRRKDKYEALKARVTEEGEVSTVDPDARLMHSVGKGRDFEPGYNVQTVVDSKNHLIVDFELTNNPRDNGNLYKMAWGAMEILGVNTITNLADKGYYNSKDITFCEEHGISCLVAKPRPGGAKKAKGFSHEDFIYDKGSDTYTCPCGKVMWCRRTRTHVSGREYRDYANYAACTICQRKSECTTAKHREIQRQTCQDTVDIVDERTRNNKALYQRRQEIVEHPFGTIKTVWGYRQFLCRTKPKVTAETALAYLAYNLRRVFNITRETRLQLVTG